MRVFACWIVVVMAMVVARPARGADEAPSISTSGQATVFVAPDRVVVALGVQSGDADLDKAKKANDGAAETLVKAIRGMGVEAGDIGTDRVNVTVHHRGGSELVYQIDGYIVQRNYSITLKDPKMLEKLIDAALKNGANQIQGVDFQSTELRKYRDQARTMAIVAAKEKAVALAKALEMGVGKAVTISESGGSSYRGGISNVMGQNSVQVMAVAGEDGGVLPLGRIAVEASVAVKFELK